MIMFVELLAQRIHSYRDNDCNSNPAIIVCCDSAESFRKVENMPK